MSKGALSPNAAETGDPRDGSSQWGAALESLPCTAVYRAGSSCLALQIMHFRPRCSERENKSKPFCRVPLCPHPEICAGSNEISDEP